MKYYFVVNLFDILRNSTTARVKRQADEDVTDYPDVESTTKKCNRKNKGGRGGMNSGSDETDGLGVLGRQQGQGGGMGNNGKQRGGQQQQMGNNRNQAAGGRQQGSMMGRMNSKNGKKLA